MILDLDHEASLDPARTGAKAAWLARGIQSGLPVLPGLVVDAPTSRHHMEVGAAALSERGSGGARLAIMSEPVPGSDDLIQAAAAIGERLVARSSTILETSGEWSGAFTSYVDVAPEELPKAVAGCWASAFSVATLERLSASGTEPGSFPMAVLIQRALQPEAGGTAAIGEDGSVTVHGVKGSPAPLLQGWSGGHTAIGGGPWRGDQLVELVGTDVLDEIEARLREAESDLGVNSCEWALEDQVWLLQLGAHVSGHREPMGYDGAVVPELVPVAIAAVRAPGRLGEELILPWGLGGLGRDMTRSTPKELSPVEALELRDRLLEQVWGMPAAPALAAARDCMTVLLGPDPGPALERVGELRHPNADHAGRLLSHLDAVLAPSHVTRLGVGRWEPFIASVTLGSGTRHSGTPASPGIGAGTRANLSHREDVDGYRRRSVVTAPQPLPNLAPLLWDTAGLVTTTGSPAAHLFESARALGVPAVCGVELPPGELMMAVDGSSGIVATIPLNGDDDE